MLIAVFLLTGCGGDAFGTFGQVPTGDGSDAGGDSGAASGTGGAADDGDAPEADAGTGGATSEGDSGSSGGSSSSGGASAGGSDSSGGGGSDGSGGSPGSGGSIGSGGTTSGSGGTVACTLVTHDNGVGQTWQDCVPLYTYDRDQAMKACKASGAPACLESERCGTGVFEVQGFNADRTQRLGEWGYGNFATGYVSPDSNLCSPDDPARKTWN